MTNNNRRQEIKEILFRNDRTTKWLQQKVPGVDLYYLLSDKCKTFDIDTYDRIMSALTKEGLTTVEDERCEKLVDEILSIDSIIGNSLILLNSNVRDFTRDNVLDFSERKKLSQLLDKIDNEFQNSINAARKIVEST